MPLIQITAASSSLGPELPTPHHAFIRQREWPGGGTVPILELHIGDCTIEVFPFDPQYVCELGQKLIRLAIEVDRNQQKGG